LDEQESCLIAEQPIETEPPVLTKSYLQALMTKKSTSQATTNLIKTSPGLVPAVGEKAFWGKPDQKPGARSSSIPTVVERVFRNEVKTWIGISEEELAILDK
jgi:hypothetical protein